MGFTEKVVKLLVVSASLATWEVYIKGFYKAWLVSQGRNMGWAEEFLGYLLVLVVAWIAAWILTRSRETDE